MSIPTNKLQYISFSSELNYLHVVATGTVVLDDQVNNSILVPLPDGLTSPFFRVFQHSPNIANGFTLPVTNFFATAASASIDDGYLLIALEHAQSQDTPNYVTFTYFIYGGNYGS